MAGLDRLILKNIYTNGKNQQKRLSVSHKKINKNATHQNQKVEEGAELTLSKLRFCQQSTKNALNALWM